MVPTTTHYHYHYYLLPTTTPTCACVVILAIVSGGWQWSSLPATQSVKEIIVKRNYLIEKRLIKKKYDKLKILGKGDLKNKLKISTDFISKSAQSKIEKAGGSVIISKNKINVGKKNV